MQISRPQQPPPPLPPPSPAGTAQNPGSPSDDWPSQEMPASERRDVIRFLLDCSSERRDQLVSDAVELLQRILAMREQLGASDIQFRTDMHVYIHTKDDIPAQRDLPKMDIPMMAGLWLALKRSDPSFYASDESNYIRAFPERHYDDFAAEGGNPLTPLITNGRMRVQVFLFDKGLGITCRILSDDIPPLTSLGFAEPHIEILQKMVQLRQGIGFVSGPMGSGKSTTLAALVNWLIHTHPRHVVTHEDPIEYRYPDSDGRGMPLPGFVTQQEIGAHLPNFEHGLRSGLRKMSQVTLVGEIRDAETMEAAFTASGTGQFVLATTHAESAGGTLDRILDLFPANRHDSVLSRLANTSRFFLCQKLLYGLQQRTRVLAYELLQIPINDSGVKNAMKNWRDRRSEFNQNLLSQPNQRFNQHLKTLAATGKISPETLAENTLAD